MYNDKTNTVKTQKEQQKFYEEIVADVKSDFEKRQKERIALERQWELNMNFLTGNQYCFIDKNGEMATDDKSFYWQNREVFNHIAPLVESRIAKFSKLEPIIAVKPRSNDDKDYDNAFVMEKLIKNAFERANLLKTVKKVTTWSETCGTGFYKVIWNENGGNKVGVFEGRNVFEGDPEIIPVSPFEIFPDNLYTEELQDLSSIIHAKAVPVSIIKEKYGVDVAGNDVSVYNLSIKNSSLLSSEQVKTVINNSAIVIEKYEKPSVEFPKGRLITIAGDKLLYYGELPYYNDEQATYFYPFVKQESQNSAGNFFGSSIIERLIPVQRAYNAVKNRKHEFMNRLSMGIMNVEDGSIDVEELAEDGLSPGKILVYRQGSTPPEMMEGISMPTEFNEEEDKLLNEFVVISGVSDVSSSKNNANLSSGSALQMLIEQDNERLVPVAERIRNCCLEIARQVISLYTVFLVGVRAIKYKDGFDKIRICYIDKNKVNAEEIYMERENELLMTSMQKKDITFKLLETGLLNDENGVIREEIKEKLLISLGYKDLDYQKGLSTLQMEKAQYENGLLREKELPVEEIDNHEIHVEEHTRYVLSEYSELSETQKQNVFKHVREHKQAIKQIKGESINART